MSETFAIDRETHLREHSFAANVERDQRKFIDQTTLTLSGGALAISLAFIDSAIGPNGAALLPQCLATAWAALVSSIITVLAGMHASQCAIDRHIKNLDARGSALPR